MKLWATLCVLCILPSLLLGQVSTPAPKLGADGTAGQPVSQNPARSAQQSGSPGAPAGELEQGLPEIPALRSLIDQYFAAYEKKDLDGLMGLWSSQSPNLASNREAAQQFFAANDKIVVSNMAIAETKFEGDKARLRVQVEMSSTDVKTGKAATDKSVRILECVKESGAWKVWRETDAVEELAALLVAAKSEQEKTALLDRDKELVNPALVEALRRLAEGLSNRKEYESALSVYGTAQGIATAISDQRGMARILHGIGTVWRLTGKYTEALESYRKSQQIFESTGDKDSIARVLLDIGIAHESGYEYTQALEDYSKGLALAEEVKDQDYINRLLQHAGALYLLREGDYARALECFQKSLAISRTIKDQGREAYALNSIGRVYLSQHDSAEALRYLQQALDLGRKIGDKGAIGTAIGNSGIAYRYQGDFDNALERYREALAVFEETGDNHGIAASFDALGELYSFRKDYDQALVFFDRGLKLSQEHGDQRRTISVLISMAEARYAQRDLVKALDLADRALAGARKIEDRRFVGSCREIAGKIYQALHKPDEARRAFDDAIAVVESRREGVVGGAYQQSSFLADKLDAYYGMVGVLVAQSEFSEALSYAERAKGRTLLDVLGNRRVNIKKAMTTAEREREEELQTKLVSLNRQLGAEKATSKPDAGHVADLQSGLEQAQLQDSDFHTNLYAAHPELRAQRGQIQPLSFSDAAGLLPDSHSAILEFVVAEEKTYLFVLTRNTGVNATSPELNVYAIDVKARDLEKETEQFRRQLSVRDLQFSAAALRLFKLLLQPAQAQLSGVTALLIVPDGPLWNLPFQAMQPRPGHYLLEDYAVAYAPSLTILREMVGLRLRNKDAPAIAAHQTLLAMGNPALASATSELAKLTYRDEKLAPLPEAAREVKTLGSLYGRQQSKVFVGVAAAEDRFKAQAGEFRILHLATHGFLNDANPMYSHVLLSPGSAKEDGLLEAWEIMNLDLHADLVVLSACETARGHISRGEGVLGLSWAFFVAGVPTTVVSQWKVESTSTAELMLAFHQALKTEHSHASRTFSTARALQHAELRVLHDPRFSDPVYWAGFIVVGDPQ